MSQRSEKYARNLGGRMDGLEADMALLRAEMRTRSAYARRSVEDADECAVRSRRIAWRAKREAEQWRRTAWLAVIALMLCAAVAMTVKVKAEPPAEEIPAPVEEPLVQEDYENEKIEAVLLEKANVIEDCTVTWYTEDTCGKSPDHPAYGITYSGLPVTEHLTCAVDTSVIPLYSDVWVEYATGAIEQLWATDTGVKGKVIDIYTPDYDAAIQNGRQSLNVWWLGPEDTR